VQPTPAPPSANAVVAGGDAHRGVHEGVHAHPVAGDGRVLLAAAAQGRVDRHQSYCWDRRGLSRKESPMSETVFLTREEAAAASGKSKDTIRRYEREGKPQRVAVR
jgi:hypothetical protein